jgi:hypothetical protein
VSALGGDRDLHTRRCELVCMTEGDRVLRVNKLKFLRVMSWQIDGDGGLSGDDVEVRKEELKVSSSAVQLFRLR